MSGIRNIKQIANKYKEAEIYFHQDLDGVCSHLAMKSYLESHGIKVVDSHIIQYGSLEFNVKNTKEGRLPVIVDFAHVKDMFVIATDHHDKQAGASSNMSTNFKKSSSNVETISGEISNANVFLNLDIELIKTVDSADYARYKISPEQIQKAFFKLNKDRTSGSNRFLMGLVVNRLLLALKNKRIKVNSLDGKTYHNNRNLLECLVTDSKPSLYSLYLNLKNYINNATSYEWNMDLKSYHNPVKLPTQEQLNYNLNNYILSRQEFIKNNDGYKKNHELDYDSQYKIIKQFDIGETFKTGSYDRYVVFRNFPQSDWVCTIYKMGLVQISGNPFKSGNKDIHLGNITKELLTKYKEQLSNFRIPITALKRINESESYKLKQKYANFSPIGFKFNDLNTFYGQDIYYLPNRKLGDLKTISKLDLSDTNNLDVQFVKTTMDKLWTDWTFEDKQEMSNFKIPGLNILEIMSGGHTSITNIQGLNFLDERRDAIKKYFGHIAISLNHYDGSTYNKYISTFEDLMVFFASEYLEILKSKLNGENANIDNDIHLYGVSSQNTI
jgi:hypothetical protein